jgi:hypothetical protein
MSAVMQFLETTFGPPVFLFTVSNLAGHGPLGEDARSCRLDDYNTPSADLAAHLQAIIDEAFGRTGQKRDRP